MIVLQLTFHYSVRLTRQLNLSPTYSFWTWFERKLAEYIKYSHCCSEPCYVCYLHNNNNYTKKKLVEIVGFVVSDKQISIWSEKYEIRDGISVVFRRNTFWMMTSKINFEQKSFEICYTLYIKAFVSIQMIKIRFKTY